MKLIKNKIKSKTNVYDCFLYAGEVDLLDIRINYLKNNVTKFLVFEADQDFHGKKRNVIKLNNDNEKIIHKIIYFPNNIEFRTAKEREYWFRNQIKINIDEVEATDILLISDVDEIPNKNNIAKLKGEITYFELLFMYFYFNYVNISSPNWVSSFGGSKSEIIKYDLNDLRFKKKYGSKIIKNAGWHFSYLGGTATVRKKLLTLGDEDIFSMSERNEILKKNDEELEKLIISGKDIFGRKFKWLSFNKRHLENFDIYPEIIKYNNYFIQSKGSRIFIIISSLIQRFSPKIHFLIYSKFF